LLRQQSVSAEPRKKSINSAMPVNCYVAPQRNSDASVLLVVLTALDRSPAFLLIFHRFAGENERRRFLSAAAIKD
jgi:hypothetical protein